MNYILANGGMAGANGQGINIYDRDLDHDHYAYVGTFKDDYFHGHGAVSHLCMHQTHIGTWRDGNEYDEGIALNHNGDILYLGEFKDSQFHGHGAWMIAGATEYIEP